MAENPVFFPPHIAFKWEMDLSIIRSIVVSTNITIKNIVNAKHFYQFTGAFFPFAPIYLMHCALAFMHTVDALTSNEQTRTHYSANKC